MFPFRDHDPSGRRPHVTIALIAVNLAVFALTWPAIYGPGRMAWLDAHWAAIPAHLAMGRDWATILSAMFLHAGAMHILGNMLFLWVFGDLIEDALGHLGFAAFYLGAGIAATLTQTLADPASQLPLIGASGAVAGVMGGYLVLFPRARIDVLLVIVIFVRVITLPAWSILGLWIAIQAGAGAFSAPVTGGVAYMAHVGGFSAGIAMALRAWLRGGGLARWRCPPAAPGPRRPEPRPDALGHRKPM